MGVQESRNELKMLYERRQNTISYSVKQSCEEILAYKFKNMQTNLCVRVSLPQMNLSLLHGPEFLFSFHSAIILYIVPCQAYAGFISFHWMREDGKILHIPFHNSVYQIGQKKEILRRKRGGDGDKNRNILFITFPGGTSRYFPYFFFLKVNLYPEISLSATQEHCFNASGYLRMLLTAAR